MVGPRPAIRQFLRFVSLLEPVPSTTTSPGFNFTWSGWDVTSRQGVYLHNSPYSGAWEIPYGLNTWNNPVEQPNSAWPVTPEEPTPYTSPSQQYVDDLDDFFYGYDNSDLYEEGLQDYGEITVTNASGSTSFSSQTSFYSAFSDGTLSNEGVGSGLTAAQKQYVQEKFEETGNEPNEEEGSENQKASLLFDDFGDNAQFLRDVHGRLTEKLDQFYEQFKISKTKEEVSREAKKAIRKALSAAQKEIKK